MEVVPSPKSQLHAKGAPADVSAKVTVAPAQTGAFEVKAAVATRVIEIVRVAGELAPQAESTTNVTVYVPGAAKTCWGFWDVDVPPSPKSHCNALGRPVD